MLRAPASTSPGYQVFMLALSLYSIAMLALQATSSVDPMTADILDYSDFVICLAFLGDFALSLARAQNRWRYMATWGWLDLVSSIPILDLTRWGRIARVLRIFRVLRGIRATHVLSGLVFRDRAKNAVFAAATFAFLLITFCSIAIVHFEAGSGGKIRTAEDALWWSFTTITTVGYGDLVPITFEGRLVAVLLMTGGVGLFSTVSGFLATWFMGEQEQQDNVELAAIRVELARLNDALAKASSQR